MLKAILNLDFSKTGIPKNQEIEFNSELIDTNFTRSKFFAILSLFVYIILLLTDYINYREDLWIGVPGYRLLFYSHFIMAIGTLLIVGYSFLTRLGFNSEKTKSKYFFVIAFSFISLVGASLVSTADQYIHGEITVFILICLVFAILNYQRPLFNIIMYGFSYLVFIIGTSYAQPNPNILKAHYINGTLLVFLAVFLSRSLYKAKVKDFISRKTIEHQNNELAKTNQELSATNEELQESVLALDESKNIIFTLTLALESKDTNTHGHSERVGQYVIALANYLKLNDKDKVNLWRAAILHDIGKIGIPDAILNKPSSLTENEWAIMKSHPERGAEICSKLKFARELLPIIRYHHERYDGAGYPSGLKGDSIPFLARIVSIADTVDAMTSPRTYRSQPKTMEEAIDEIQRCSGTQFDPVLVKAFVEVYKSNLLDPIDGVLSYAYEIQG